MRQSADDAGDRADLQPTDPDAAPHGRHAAPVDARPRRRIRRRHKFLVLAAVVALTGLLFPPPGQSDELATGALADAALPRGLSAASVIAGLSAGAPDGALLLASAPTHVADSQPAGPQVATGLAANGIPNVALNAYRVAAERMATAQPWCGIEWSLLAGIGRIESNHGRFRGAVLNADGTSTPQIKGPPLNGGQFAFIRDTDGGRFDGDTAVDRAVGPMQFIPSTWSSYGIDGDGNGTEDPFDIDDAALASAHYLCVAGRDLRTLEGKQRAVLAYNHSDSYVAEVLALAAAYAAGIPVDDLPLVGNTTGAVPPPSGGYRFGPAAPGPAIGARDTTPAGPDTTYPAQSGSQSGGQPGAAPAGSGGSTDQGSTSSGSGGGAPAGGGGQPAPAGGGEEPAPGPAEPAAPAPSGPLPGGTPTVPSNPVPSNPVPPPPSDPVPPPPDPIPGVTCTLLNALGQPLTPGLPTCP